VAQRTIIEPMTVWQYRADTPRLVRDVHLGPGDRVAAAYQVPFPYVFNHAREVDWHRLMLYDIAQPPPADANVVIAPWVPAGNGYLSDGTGNGWVQIAADPFHGWAVWRRVAAA